MTTQSAPAPIFEVVHAASPAEIDYHLARLGTEAADLLSRLNHLRKIQARINSGEPVRWSYDENAPRLLTGIELAEFSAEVAGRVAAAETKLVENTFLAHPLETEYDERGGWRRYYLVEDGHLHYDVSSSRCSRVPSTTHYWMTEFSGQAPAEVIAQAGERVCTTCFPEAPVAPRPAAARFMTRSEAERAAYAEEKARKKAAKKAAEITTPDGRQLIVDGSHIKTERAAWNMAMREAFDLAFYGGGSASSARERVNINLCLAALAHRRGVTEESLRVELNKKIAAKARREGVEVKATA